MNPQHLPESALHARAERWLWRLIAAAIAVLSLVLLSLPVPVNT